MQRSERSVAIWLFFCAGMIFAMVVLGGVTRLTRSGLSMVTWHPVRGTLPPLNKQQWEAEFGRYKRSPEYHKVNRGMTLDDFKSIFWMEYIHRLWGRLIGLVFFVPFLIFLWLGWIRGRLIWECLLMFVGGGMQGLLGWYMVKSGLVNDPHVSQYRLVAHLSVAFLIYAYIFWTALRLWLPKEEPVYVAQDGASPEDLAGLRRFSLGLTLLIFVMVLSGGFVAGLKGGLMYNTFPKMGWYWIPPGLFYSAWAPFENPATAQFVHRIFAYVVTFSVLWFWSRTLPFLVSPRFARARGLLLLALLVQVSLGIATLLMFVPVSLGTLHQTGALCLFTASLYATFVLHQHDELTR
ncbi:MAG: COX15/CtaA family protein [Myxococcales bacterium]|nr:COX15/CtaA family protein [Myxococcales bacterium]